MQFERERAKRMYERCLHSGNRRRWWFALATGVITHRTTDDYATWLRTVWAVAKIAADHEADGKPCGVFHAVWLLNGSVGPCYCMPCSRLRGER